MNHIKRQLNHKEIIINFHQCTLTIWKQNNVYLLKKYSTFIHSKKLTVSNWIQISTLPKQTFEETRIKSALFPTNAQHFRIGIAKRTTLEFHNFSWIQTGDIFCVSMWKFQALRPIEREIVDNGSGRACTRRFMVVVFTHADHGIFRWIATDSCTVDGVRFLWWGGVEMEFVMKVWDSWNAGFSRDECRDRFLSSADWGLMLDRNDEKSYFIFECLCAQWVYVSDWSDLNTLWDDRYGE